ncbi:MAG: rod-binding protein [Spirochaetales bacterium]|nr:rod-binding protein [Spirochaetales bacterium]
MEITDAASLQYRNTSLNASLESVKRGGISEAEEAKLKEACQDFESLFIKQMLDTMRKTVNKGELLNGGMAEDIFEDMLYDEYASAIAGSGDFGISKMMYSELAGRR